VLYFFFISSLILLGIIIFQDFKSRAIWWFLAPVLFFAQLGYAIAQNSFSMRSTLLNIALILTNIGSVWLYFYFRKKGKLEFFKEMFGLGDLLMLIALSVLFSPYNFILFFILSCILSLALHYILIYLKVGNRTIPFAGYIALFYAVLFISDTFNLYNCIS